MSVYHLQSKLGKVISQNNQEYLYFSGTDYLGMNSLREFEEIVIKSIRQIGLNHGLSRVNNVRLNVYDDFEAYFAEKAGADKALVWSSGYLAGYATLNHLIEQIDYIFIAPDTHPAILPDGLAPDPSQSFSDWVSYSQEMCENLKPQKILILANAVDPLKPTLNDFSWIGHLPRKHDYIVLLDDSHAFGVVGDTIFGTYNKWKYLPVDLIVAGSLGKGLGLPAGITLGPVSPLISLATQNIFRSSSPPPQAYLLAFLQAQHLYEAQHVKLLSNIQYFASSAKQVKGMSGNSSYPVFSFQNRDWVKKLEEEGFIVSSFPYPGPTDPWTNRIVIAAYHEKDDLKKLHHVLDKIQVEAPGVLVARV